MQLRMQMRLLVLVLVVQLQLMLVVLQLLLLLLLMQLLTRQCAHQAAIYGPNCTTWYTTGTTKPTGSRSKQRRTGGPIGAQPTNARATLRIVARRSPEGYCVCE